MSSEGTPRFAPYVSVAGAPGAGATTFTQGLATELAARGWRVAVVAPDPVGPPSSESIVRVASALADESDLLEVAVSLADEVDVVIGDGVVLGGRRCIEVSRVAVSETLVCEPGDALAVATDNEGLDPFAMSLFALDDYDYVADAIEERFLSGGDRRER